jgi:membrane-bound ClpP family serine protease
MYLVCAVIGAVLTCAMFVLPHDDHGIHFDDTFKLPGLRSIGGALLLFGAVGGFLSSVGWSPWVVAPLAVLVGVLTGGTIGWATRRMIAMERNSALSVDTALWESGTVYVPIPADGRGKIMLTLQGRTVELEAIADEPLPYGQEVEVVSVDGELVQVRKISPGGV